MIKMLKNGLLLTTVSLSLTACDSSADRELLRYMDEVKTRKAQPIEPMPEFPQLSSFPYPENEIRRSPFKPKEREQSVDKSAPNTTRPKQALEQFSLDSLRFVGILKQDAIVWGLVVQPGGRIIRIKPGSFMGQNYGEVIKIEDNAIVLQETVQVVGKWEKKTTILHINALKKE